MGGLSGADAICQGEADRAGLGGTFVAWLSTSDTDARDRVDDVLYRRLDGQLVAVDLNDLTDGSIANPINLDVDGGVGGGPPSRRSPVLDGGRRWSGSGGFVVPTAWPTRRGVAVTGTCCSRRAPGGWYVSPARVSSPSEGVSGWLCCEQARSCVKSLVASAGPLRVDWRTRAVP